MEKYIEFQGTYLQPIVYFANLYLFSEISSEISKYDSKIGPRSKVQWVWLFPTQCWSVCLFPNHYFSLDFPLTLLKINESFLKCSVTLWHLSMITTLTKTSSTVNVLCSCLSKGSSMARKRKDFEILGIFW